MADLFKAVKKQSIHDMTVGELGKYLDLYARVQFPESGIDYWSSMIGKTEARTEGNSNDKLIGYDTEPRYHHVASYARKGRCEGGLIDVCIMLNDESVQQIARAKTFGSHDENWAIARALYEVVDSLYSNEELPLIVDFAASLPITPINIKNDGNHNLQFLRDEATLTVLFDGDAEVAHYDESDKGGNAKFYIDSYLADWERLAKNLDMQILSPSEDESPAPDH